MRVIKSENVWERESMMTYKKNNLKAHLGSYGEKQ